MAFTFSCLSLVGSHDLGRDLRGLRHINECGFNMTPTKKCLSFLQKMKMELFSLEEDDTKNLFITQFITQVSF